MRIRGVKRGQIIELLEQINDIPDGKEIIVDLKFSATSIEETKQSLTDSERLARLNKLFGAWKDQPDLIEIFK
jgi:DNA anti-recombination protein RmuC